jgi:hypothetical protein
MGILLGFTPFIAFAVANRLAGLALSLWMAAAVSLVLILRTRTRGESPKVLEIGTLVFFALLGLVATVLHVRWNISLVRCVVDGGLLGIMLLSIVVGRPFTLEYARERVPSPLYDSRLFIRQNYIITAVWAVSMAIIVLADLVLHYVQRFPAWAAGIAIAAAFTGALVFSRWYPRRGDQHGRSKQV